MINAAKVSHALSSASRKSCSARSSSQRSNDNLNAILWSCSNSGDICQGGFGLIVSSSASGNNGANWSKCKTRNTAAASWSQLGRVSKWEAAFRGCLTTISYHLLRLGCCSGSLQRATYPVIALKKARPLVRCSVFVMNFPKKCSRMIACSDLENKALQKKCPPTARQSWSDRTKCGTPGCM